MPYQDSSLEHPRVQAERAAGHAEACLKRQQQILADTEQDHVSSAVVAARLVLVRQNRF
jgi:hypothetical protein